MLKRVNVIRRGESIFNKTALLFGLAALLILCPQISLAAPWDDAVAMYDMNYESGDTDAPDLSGEGNDMSFAGGIEGSEFDGWNGGTNSAVNVDGSGDFIYSDSSDFNFSGSFSVSFYYHDSSAIGDKTLLGKWDEGESKKQYMFWMHNNPDGGGGPTDERMTFCVSSDGTSETCIQEDSDYGYADWVNYTAVYNQSEGNISLYKNGVSTATPVSFSGPVYSSDVNTRIGRVVNGPVGSGYCHLDDVAFWDRVLTEDEIRMLASNKTFFVGKDSDGIYRATTPFDDDFDELGFPIISDYTGLAVSGGGSIWLQDLFSSGWDFGNIDPTTIVLSGCGGDCNYRALDTNPDPSSQALKPGVDNFLIRSAESSDVGYSDGVDGGMPTLRADIDCDSHDNYTIKNLRLVGGVKNEGSGLVLDNVNRGHDLRATSKRGGADYHFSGSFNMDGTVSETIWDSIYDAFDDNETTFTFATRSFADIESAAMSKLASWQDGYTDVGVQVPYTPNAIYCPRDQVDFESRFPVGGAVEETFVNDESLKCVVLATELDTSSSIKETDWYVELLQGTDTVRLWKDGSKSDDVTCSEVLNKSVVYFDDSTGIPSEMQDQAWLISDCSSGTNIFEISYKNTFTMAERSAGSFSDNGGENYLINLDVYPFSWDTHDSPCFYQLTSAAVTLSYQGSVDDFAYAGLSRPYTVTEIEQGGYTCGENSHTELYALGYVGGLKRPWGVQNTNSMYNDFNGDGTMGRFEFSDDSGNNINMAKTGSQVAEAKTKISESYANNYAHHFKMQVGGLNWEEDPTTELDTVLSWAKESDIPSGSIKYWVDRWFDSAHGIQTFQSAISSDENDFDEDGWPDGFESDNTDCTASTLPYQFCSGTDAGLLMDYNSSGGVDDGAYWVADASDEGLAKVFSAIEVGDQLVSFWAKNDDGSSDSVTLKFYSSANAYSETETVTVSSSTWQRYDVVLNNIPDFASSGSISFSLSATTLNSNQLSVDNVRIVPAFEMEEDVEATITDSEFSGDMTLESGSTVTRSQFLNTESVYINFD